MNRALLPVLGAMAFGLVQASAEPASDPIWGVWADVGHACDGPRALSFSPGAIMNPAHGTGMFGEWMQVGEEPRFRVHEVAGSLTRQRQNLIGAVLTFRREGKRLRFVRSVGAQGDEQAGRQGDVMRRCR